MSEEINNKIQQLFTQLEELLDWDVITDEGHLDGYEEEPLLTLDELIRELETILV